MLAAVKKGRQVNEAEIPPAVATGAQSTNSGPAIPQRTPPPVPSPPESTLSDQSVPEIVTPSSEEEQSSTQPILSCVPSPDEPTEEPVDQPHTYGQCQLEYVHLYQLYQKLSEIIYDVKNCRHAFFGDYH